MIQDRELRELFHVESDEHLSSLEKGLLSLESNPNQPALIQNLFREAHSMKGAARMLGIKDMETITHVLEDELGKIKVGQAALTKEKFDSFYVTIDALRKLTKEAVSDEKADVNVVHLVELLKGNAVVAPKKTKEEHHEEVDRQEERSQPRKESAPEQTIQQQVPRMEAAPPPPPSQIQTPMPTEKYKIDTMRVEPAKLDVLMSLAGELTVTKNRIQRRSTELDSLLSSFDQIGKLISEVRGNLRLSGKEKKILEDSFNKIKDRLQDTNVILQTLRGRSQSDGTKLETITSKLEEGIQNIRLLPLSNVFSLFNRTVRDLSKETGKEVQFMVEGGDVTADKGIIEELKDPLMHLIRNCIDHGLETPEERERAGKQDAGTLSLIGANVNNQIIITVSDDGRGLSLERIKNKAKEKKLYTAEELAEMEHEKIYNIIFQPGFSTNHEVTAISGRGIGMDVVKNFVDNFKGTISIETESNKGTTFTLRLPIRYSTTHVLLAKVGDQIFAVPADNVIQSKLLVATDLFKIQNKPSVLLNGEVVPLGFLSGSLEMANQNKFQSPHPCIFLEDNDTKLGFLVDAILDKQEVILKPFAGIIKKIRNVTGGTILESGEICIVLNTRDLIRNSLKNFQNFTFAFDDLESKEGFEILVVDDSSVTRNRIGKILESSGYKVTIAVDGGDAFNKLKAGKFDLVLTDREMPNMDGIQLAGAIRSSNKLNSLPIIMLSSFNSPRAIQTGLEAGANAYLLKTAFDQKELLKTVRRLLSTNTNEKDQNSSS